MFETFEDAIFGAKVATRTCGTCRACETLFGEKDSTQWDCAWRRIAGMPDRMRPDLMGVRFDLVLPDKPPNLLHALYIRGEAVDERANFDAEDVQGVLGMFANAAPLPIWMQRQGRMNLVHPAPEIAGIVLGTETPRNDEDAAEAKKWRDTLTPLMTR